MHYRHNLRGMKMKRRGFDFGQGDDPFGGEFGGRGRGFGPRGPKGPRRHRQRRGDIRFVLLQLLKDESHHGYELIKAIEERSGGFYRPSPGMIYPTLQLLEEEGNLTSQLVDDKRVYTITDAGRKLLEEQENSQQGGPRWGRHKNQDFPQMMELRQSMMALFESVMQTARYGTPEQVKAVQGLIEATNQQVHAIMAQSRPSDTV